MPIKKNYVGFLLKCGASTYDFLVSHCPEDGKFLLKSLVMSKQFLGNQRWIVPFALYFDIFIAYEKQKAKAVL